MRCYSAPPSLFVRIPGTSTLLRAAKPGQNRRSRPLQAKYRRSLPPISNRPSHHLKPPRSDPEATLEPPRGYLQATLKLPAGYAQATPKPADSQPIGNRGPPQSVPKATRQPDGGHARAIGGDEKADGPGAGSDAIACRAGGAPLETCPLTDREARFRRQAILLARGRFKRRMAASPMNSTRGQTKSKPREDYRRVPLRSPTPDYYDL